MIWGIDLGVRSLYVAGIDRPFGHLFLLSSFSKRGDRYQEIWEALKSTKDFHYSDTVYIEEPPMAGSRNVRTFLQLGEMAGAVMARCPCPVYLVPVDSWKKSTVGKGGVNKETVALWLKTTHEDYASQCGGDQNLIDATCIALHGSAVLQH